MSKGFGMVPAWFSGQLTTNEIAVWVALTWHADKDGSCWPSHSAIGEAVGLSESSVKRALNGLRDKALVTWEKRTKEAGGDTSNLYHLDMSGGSERPTPQVTQTPPVGHSDRRTRTNEPDSLNNTPTPSSPAVMVGSSVDVIEEGEFETFWRVYPRQVGKRTAEKAYWRAVSRSGSTAVLAGAERLANDPNLPDKQFIPHPTTWLNRDGWEDDPFPPRTNGKPSKMETVSRAMDRLAEMDQPTLIDTPMKEITR